MSAHATLPMSARERLSRWRRKQRALHNADRTTCAARLTRTLRCETPLQNRFVNGETVPFCPTCDRRRRGICIACTTQAVAGKIGAALYCALCKKLKRQEADARFRAAHREQRAAAERARLADPERRAKHKERSRLINLAMPQKAARWRRATNARRREKRQAYDAARRAASAAVARERRALRKAGLLPPRTCVSCPTAMTGRARKCEACRARHRAEARAALAAMWITERAA